FSSRRRHTRSKRDWSSDVCSSDLPVTGIINNLIQFLGFEPISFMTEPSWFKTIFVLSGEWQNLGWGAIIYLAALAGVDPELHERSEERRVGKWSLCRLLSTSFEVM